MWLLLAAAIVALAHTAPFPFLLDVTPVTVWHMPDTDPPTVYLTFDDGPNPTATPALLDVLARHQVRATFFLIDKYVTAETAPMVRRMFDDGHAVALHSHTRALMIKSPRAVTTTLNAAAMRLEQLAGHAPCRAFRPHAGNRSVTMLMGAARGGYTVVGWSWMLWDWNWFKACDADVLVPRFVNRASAGDIIVVHDGHHKDPRADRRYAVATIDRLIPALRARGFLFGTICP
jgi:peptidoglycan/xylan/chitin deacetylase (PgdA/CDA1 family)